MKTMILLFLIFSAQAAFAETHFSEGEVVILTEDQNMSKGATFKTGASLEVVAYLPILQIYKVRPRCLRGEIIETMLVDETSVRAPRDQNEILEGTNVDYCKGGNYLAFASKSAWLHSPMKRTSIAEELIYSLSVTWKVEAPNANIIFDFGSYHLGGHLSELSENYIARANTPTCDVFYEALKETEELAIRKYSDSTLRGILGFLKCTRLANGRLWITDSRKINSSD